MPKASKTTNRRGRKLPLVIEPNQVAAMMGACGTSTTGFRARALITAMAGCGLRAGEVVALRPCDVLLDKSLIEVRQGKGAKDRCVPVHPEDIPALATWADRRPTGARWFFCTHKGGQLSTRYLRAAIKRLAQRAGLERANEVHPHTLRHSAASNWIARGLTVVEVRDLLGHSNIATTNQYAHVRPRQLAERVASGPAVTGANSTGKSTAQSVFVTNAATLAPKSACAAPVAGDQPRSRGKGTPKKTASDKRSMPAKAGPTTSSVLADWRQLRRTDRIYLVEVFQASLLTEGDEAMRELERLEREE